MPGIASPTTRELGVIIAAGARASATSVPARPPRRVRLLGQQDALRKPLSDFLYALTHGGQLRVDDLGNRASPSGSLGDSATGRRPN